MSTTEPNDPLEPTATPEQTHSEQTHSEQARTPEQTQKSAVTSDYAPFYAVAGLTDVLASSLKKTFAQTQERAAQRAALLRGRDPALEGQARSNAEELRKLVRGVPGQAKGLSEATRARIAELQKQLQMYRREAAVAYAELAVRGKRAVDESMVTAKTLSGRAEAKVEDVSDDLADAVEPSRPVEPVDTSPVETSPVDPAPGYAPPTYTAPGDATQTPPSYPPPSYTQRVDPEPTPPIYTEPVDPDTGDPRERS